MPKPGQSVKQESDYQSKDSNHRDYWENGQNGGLTPEQKRKLSEHADRASRYNRPGRNYGSDVPRKPGSADVDHGALMKNVKQYVADTLSPHGDNPNAIAPPRSLGDMLDRAGTPENPVGPPPAAENNWVCINLGEFMAGLLRKLCYPVRETNVYLTNGGKYQYQSAALQVWFQGKWHWVDPYTCTYDPQEAWHESFSDMDVVYWNGTEPPEHSDWRVLFGLNWTFSSWWELEDDEVGGDLHDRFYPKPGQEEAKPDKKGKFRSKAEKAGCFIQTPTQNVRLYLADSHGRVTDSKRREIPGSYHIAAGKPIFYCKQEWLKPGEDPGPDYPAKYLESVFFGTHMYHAAWEEIGTHDLTLYLLGKPGTKVELQHVVMGNPHPAAVDGLPCRVILDSEVAAIPFQVIIDPIDPSFHVLFPLLVKNGLLSSEEYISTARDVGRMFERAEIHKELLKTRIKLPNKERSQ